jgi:hypothetical protein
MMHRLDIAETGVSAEEPCLNVAAP